jgi:hypothetical protein
LLVELYDRRLDVLLLCETWHGVDYVWIRRLRAYGFAAVERARLRSHHAQTSLSVNHGGVAVIDAAGIRLTTFVIGPQPSTFECAAVCITSESCLCVVVVVCRTGSAAFTANFFRELSDVLYRLSAFVDQLVLVGDINIRRQHC